ncbi:MAG: hypothetical protein KKB51_08315 [Candidatus Riflebacteria bacterium]|nr:hypothetical protein [Candidatus Riflebacteria bacterium]
MFVRSKCSGKRFCLFILCGFAAVVWGCRQTPSESPKYYQRELEQMRREALKPSQIEPALKDWYPWRGKPKLRPDPCLPCRISTREKEIKLEIDYLQEVVRGKKKVRTRFRD